MHFSGAEYQLLVLGMSFHETGPSSCEQSPFNNIRPCSVFDGVYGLNQFQMGSAIGYFC